MKLAKEDPNVVDAYLHVQIHKELLPEGFGLSQQFRNSVNNDDAMAFYKSYGFEFKETIDNYYRRIEPSGCHVYARSVDDWVDPTSS
eukprot:723208-Pyramimonas_sp.AAC.2